MAKLLGTMGATAGREYPLGDLCIIGRSPNAHIRLPDLSVSRQHAKITRALNGYIIEDLDSGLGTLVNRTSITVSHLRHNDEITIATSIFRFIDGPLEKVATADFRLVFNERDIHVVSVDASEFAQFQPLHADLDAESISRLTRRLNAMLSVGRAVSSTLEPARLLNEVLKHCLEVFPIAERALVAVPNREDQSLVVQAIAMREGIEFGQFYLSRSITSEVLYKGRSVISASGGEVADLKHKTKNPLPAGASTMVAPLICRGQMLGLIYVDHVKAGPIFAAEDLEVLTGIATQTALALYNAQMHETLMRQSRTEQELLAAHEVQKRFMPRGVPKMPGFTFAAHYEPSRDVGGDLYDFIPLDDNRIGIVVGDVSGKGFAAALVMAWVASQLRLAAHLEDSPAKVLTRVNRNLLEARQDDLFVTLFYGILDRWTMTIQFCNAGHVPPMVRHSPDGKVEIIDSGAGLPVGMVPDARFEEGQIYLEGGDTLVLVSDGVTEAMNTQKKMFGIERLRLSIAHSSANPTDLVGIILNDLRNFIQQEVQYDDITIVAIGAGAPIEDARATLPPNSYNPDDPTIG